jgi:hypothetical protein
MMGKTVTVMTMPFLLLLAADGALTIRGETRRLTVIR